MSKSEPKTVEKLLIVQRESKLSLFDVSGLLYTAEEGDKSQRNLCVFRVVMRTNRLGANQLFCG